MKHLADLLVRHRTLFLICLLTATFLLSSLAAQSRLEDDAIVTSLPVTSLTPSDAVQTFSGQRETTQLNELTALTALTNEESMDDATRRAAAAQLQALVSDRSSQQALEAALASTGLAPCAAIVSGGSVTIVTHQAEISPHDSALVLTLASAHAGASPENVRIITAE